MTGDNRRLVFWWWYRVTRWIPNDRSSTPQPWRQFKNYSPRLFNITSERTVGIFSTPRVDVSMNQWHRYTFHNIPFSMKKRNWTHLGHLHIQPVPVGDTIWPTTILRHPRDLHWIHRRSCRVHIQGWFGDRHMPRTSESVTIRVHSFDVECGRCLFRHRGGRLVRPRLLD